MNKPNLSKVKDKSVLEYISSLEDQLKTPYAEAFISLKRMVDNGTDQMKNIVFDVFTPEGETKFKQAAKFTAQLKVWYSEMEYFKSKMSPEEIVEVSKGVVKEDGVEQFLKERG
ncbi:MAG: hypothetical protein V4549_07345 [Bacteroidota bacterium]